MNRRDIVFGGASVAAIGALAWSLRGGSSASVVTQAQAAQIYEVSFTDDEWRKRLSPEAYNVLRQQGTEYPGTSPLLNEHRAGIFSCTGCDLALFDSKTKFESGTGWPSFNDPVSGSVESSEDDSYGMVRTEVHCSRCGGHLGHVFDDGPPPTHLRYCINGIAMKFEPE